MHLVSYFVDTDVKVRDYNLFPQKKFLIRDICNKLIYKHI